MTEITIRLQTDQPEINPDFFANLHQLAHQYGIRVDKNNPQERKLSHAEFVHMANEISRRIGPVNSDSTVDIRELRDTR